MGRQCSIGAAREPGCGSSSDADGSRLLPSPCSLCARSSSCPCSQSLHRFYITLLAVVSKVLECPLRFDPWALDLGAGCAVCNTSLTLHPLVPSPAPASRFPRASAQEIRRLQLQIWGTLTSPNEVNTLLSCTNKQQQISS